MSKEDIRAIVDGTMEVLKQEGVYNITIADIRERVKSAYDVVLTEAQVLGF